MIESQRPHGHITGTGRILELLCTCTSGRLLSQIQAQILQRCLLVNVHVVSSVLSASRRLGLFSSGAPLLLSTLFSSSRSHASLLYDSNYLIGHLDPSSDGQFLVFSSMLRNSISPNELTHSLLLRSIFDLRKIQQGQMVHAHIIKTGFESDIHVKNSLINLYSSCGQTFNSKYLFDGMSLRNVVSWTSLITSYNHYKRFGEALFVFKEMQRSGVLPNQVTVINVLSACAGCRAFNLGLSLHGLVERKGWRMDDLMATALLNMYGKCGRTDISIKLFNVALVKSVITWNSLISCLSVTNGKKAVSFFFEMKHKRVKADEVTLIAVLSACSRAGMIRVGEWIFQTILEGKYGGVIPGIKHYGCMVDMYSRAGLFEEALECIDVMPFEPNTFVWRALLSGCMDKGNAEFSEIALKQLVELDPRNAAEYNGLLADLFMENGNQRQAGSLSVAMEEVNSHEYWSVQKIKY